MARNDIGKSRKKLKQTKLNFSPATPNSSQIRNRIVGSVCSTLACGNMASPDTICENLMRHFVTKDPKDFFCQGCIEKKINRLTCAGRPEGRHELHVC